MIMFNGRIDRTGFILGAIYSLLPVVLIALIGVVLILISLESSAASRESLTGMFNVIYYIFGGVWAVLYIPVTIGLSVRRLHDMNLSGWYGLFYFVPIVGNIFFWVLVFFGARGGDLNEYGAKLSPRGFDRVIFGPHKEDLQVAPTPPIIQQPADPPTSTQI
jgi:uncharacterized membrane protein YhaH (DUF805 family)